MVRLSTAGIAEREVEEDAVEVKEAVVEAKEVVAERWQCEVDPVPFLDEILLLLGVLVRSTLVYPK
jgi:hypothetical protein